MCTSILPGNAVPKMTYTVSGGTLNSTHSLSYPSPPHLLPFNRHGMDGRYWDSC